MMNGKVDEIRSKCIDFDVPLEWGIEKKKEYLSGVIMEMKDSIRSSMQKLTNPMLKPVERELVFSTMKELKEKEKMATGYIASLSHNTKGSNLSDEKIEAAKEYPIDKLIEVKGGFALCPFHHDRNPSFYVKNGFGYCFSCGENADSIAISMKVNHISFTEAVKELTT